MHTESATVDERQQRFPERWARARDAGRHAGLDAIYLAAGPNYAWLTGGSPYPGGLPIWLSALVLGVDRDSVAVVSVMHADILDLKAADIAHVVTYEDGDDPVGVLKRAFDAVRLRGTARVGVEDSLWFADYSAIVRAAPDLEVVSAQHALDVLRAVKDPFELSCLRQSGRAVDAGFAAASRSAHEGATLPDVGVAITTALLAEGASDPRLGGSFKSYGHKPLEHGAVIDVDIGGGFAGYSVDTARNIFVGAPNADVVRLYEAVQEAYLAAEAVVTPGVTAEAVHAACDEIMRGRGYTQPWKVGHGVGLAPNHEAPLLQRGDTTRLEPNMVFTIDPGTFLRRDEPIHVEETVVVTETGCERLCTYPHDLHVV
jgi:Xaa-Pro aminopeptidase